MLKTDNQDARTIFRKMRLNINFAHEYISFIYRNFPNEEINQYTIAEWQATGTKAGLITKGQSALTIADELRTTVPNYQDLMCDLFGQA